MKYFPKKEKHLLHNYLFGAVKLDRNTNARNAWNHSDGTLARNVIIFGVGNSASHFTKNGRNDFFAIESHPAQFVEDINNFF